MDILIYLFITAVLSIAGFYFGAFCVFMALRFSHTSRKTIVNIVEPILLEFLRWIVINERFESSNLDKTVHEYAEMKMQESKNNSGGGK